MKKKVLFAVIILIIGLIAVYFSFFYTKTCSDVTCFNTAITKCTKAYFLEDSKEAVWHYAIKGKSAETCVIAVKLIQIKEGNQDLAGMEDSSMTCSITLGTISRPQENLENCHGMLKENMQNLMIKRL
ncbi:MAG: hypothetical protein NT076_01050, partial [Candidatus Pacearchaeota archaeon]|nr:hypothetical protein [Candidatus Pacearchaeota archaeon]